MARSSKGTAELKVGDKAPDFSLLGTKEGAGKGKGFGKHSLSDWKGKNVVLVFYPAAFTPV